MGAPTGERFTAPGDPVERLLYACSLFVCLPHGMAGARPGRPSAATGTVMRPATLRRYALEAGFGASATLHQGERHVLMERPDLVPLDTWRSLAPSEG